MSFSLLITCNFPRETIFTSIFLGPYHLDNAPVMVGRTLFDGLNGCNLSQPSVSDSQAAISAPYINNSFDTSASDACDLVKKAFIEGGQEHQLFSELYTKIAIEKRLAETT